MIGSSQDHRRLVFGATTIDALALGFYLASAGLFLNLVIDMAPGAVGIVLGLGGAASMVGAIPIAALTERYDGTRVLTGLFLARGAAFLTFALAHDPVSATLVVTVAGFLNRGIGPIIQSLALAGTDRQQQVSILAKLRALRNAGIGMGGIPVGLIVAARSDTGFRLMLAAAGAIALSAALLSLSLPSAAPPSRDSASGRPHVESGFVKLTVTYGLLSMSGIVLGLGLPLLIVNTSDVPRWTVGGIQVGNTIMVVALQVFVSRGSERVTRARSMLAAGGLVTALGCLLLIELGHTRGAVAVILVFACIGVFTMAELWASAGGMGLLLTFFPQEQRARYLAVFNLGFAGATIVGPPLVGLAVAHQPWSWAALGLVFVVTSAFALTLQPGQYAVPVEQ